MKKRIFKQGMALMLAAALALPANVVPAEILDQQTETELPHIVLNQETPDEKATDSDAKEKEEQTGTQTEIKTKTEVNATETAEQIIYNTGSFNVHVVSAEDFENDLGDAYFEEDGSYTINIPEENPFFPYEVQFTYDGKTENEWFMNPEDSIEIDGHTFYVSASFDGTAVTQLTMEVAGQEVVVYPKEKEFTDGDGVALMSLLPLEERNLSLDLSGFTPIELTRVKLSSIYTGGNQLNKTDDILWKPRNNNDSYNENSVNQTDYLDLSYMTSGSDSTSWEMIVGKCDQLASSNIRYYIDIAVTNSKKWLIPSLTLRDADGTIQDATITDYHYDDYSFTSNSKSIYVYYWESDKTADELNKFNTISLKIDQDLFVKSTVSRLEASGNYNTLKDVQTVEKNDGWYIVGTYYDTVYVSWGETLTIKAFNETGDEIGKMNLYLYVGSDDDYINTRLYDKTGNSISYTTTWNYDDSNVEEVTYNLSDSYAENDSYRLVMTFEKALDSSTSRVLGAFIGKYESLKAAKTARATDIKDSLFSREEGYESDFSKGVYISVFTGNEGDQNPTGQIWHIFTKSGKYLSSSTAVSFYGINDAQGNYVTCKVLDPSYGDYKDDYADFSYTTILVGEDTDLTSLAPVFTMQNGMKLYTNKEEISGQSLHDFSNGPVHYTASAENSKNAKNYWLQIIKPKQGESWLYMNSLADEDSDTKEENGVIYTTREIMLNGVHNYEHRIILANMGTKTLSKLSVEAEGIWFDDYQEVYLDHYWTLKGEQDLSGYQGLDYDNLANLAKLKLFYDAEARSNGEDFTGKLTIKEDGKPIMVINLTGVVGDPGIVTTEIPDAVKFVHYGSMIQNNNKYDFNTVSYKITSGKLPSGMELKSNGELYGVPLETGEFTFTVQMKNSYSKFANSFRTFTLKVVDNTDANVDSAVDKGYDLKERVPDILLSDNNDYTMTSVGVIEEWDNLTLDGKRLVEGVDFDAKSGSTRLTIRSQTLKANNQVGTHTLSAEFREKGTGNLKRAAQNYRVGRKSSGGSSGGGHSSSGRATVRADVGNIGADGAWMQDAKGWKCKAADGTWYTNCWKELTYQNEKSWYRFDAQGYLVTGWYQDNGTWYYLNPKSDGKLGKMMTGWQYINDIWYYFTENAGDKQGAMFCKRWAELPYNGTVEWYYFDENGTMKTDWLTQDENKFYLYPIADGTRGRMLTGWQKIGDNWYYFHEESDGYKGVLARRTRIGNYYVNADGVWAK